MHTDAVQTRQVVLDGLARSYLFDGVTRDELAPLAESSTTRSLIRGEFLWRVGAQAHEIYVVVSGELKDSIVDVDGFELIHFVHGPGMTVGEPGYFAVDHERVVEVVALAPTEVIRLAREHLTPFMAAHPSTKDRALERLASNTRWQSTMIVSMTRRTLPERVALRLLELVDSNPEQLDGCPVTPRLSQSTLAGMVGVSRENVNRALAALITDGYVGFADGRYVITDEARLRERIARDWPIAGRRDRRKV